MPPFAPADCPHCRHRNRFDIAELRKKDALAYKTVFREVDEEFSVTCENCGRDFKINVKGGQDGTAKKTTRGG